MADGRRALIKLRMDSVDDSHKGGLVIRTGGVVGKGGPSFQVPAALRGPTPDHRSGRSP